MRAMSDSASDADLMRRSCRQPAAFEPVFERHFASVYRYLRRRVGEAGAEELAAETFLRAFGARERYRARSETALPWLLGIATHLMLEQFRQQERQQRAYARAASMTELERDDRTDDRLIASEEARQIITSITLLPEAQREVLLLSAWAGLSSEEIGEALSIPAATARSRLSRARASVLESLSLNREER
jgi:RNA polymerase sigma factor (sigma-70 family)